MCPSWLGRRPPTLYTAFVSCGEEPSLPLLLNVTPCLSLGTGQASSTCLHKGPSPKSEAAGRAVGDPVPPDQTIRGGRGSALEEEAVPERAEAPGGTWPAEEG